MSGALLCAFLPYSWPSFWGKIMQQKEVWLNYFKRRRQYRYLSMLYNKLQRHVTVRTRHISVRTCRLVGCHAPVATLLRPRGNVVTAPWQRCYGPVATLIWARGNVVMGPWQRTKPYVQTLTSLIKGGTKGLKPRKATEGRNGLIGFIPRVHPCTFRSRSF